MPRPDFRSSVMESATPAFLQSVAPSAADPLALLLRELIDEIKGLRGDLRREVLHREVSRLPKPIQDA